MTSRTTLACCLFPFGYSLERTSRYSDRIQYHYYVLLRATQLESNGSIHPQLLVAWRERKGTPENQCPPDHLDQVLASLKEGGQAFVSLPAMPVLHSPPGSDARESVKRMRAAAYLGIPTKEPAVGHGIGLSQHSRQRF